MRGLTRDNLSVPLLPRGQRPLRVLHVSDVHMTPGQRKKQEWLAGLAEAPPPPGRQHRRQHLPPRLRAGCVRLARRAAGRARGCSWFGSNDYYSPTLRNPLRYLLPDDGQHNTHTPGAAVARASPRSTANAGWLDLTNRQDGLTVGETTFAFAGVDDPHLKLRPPRLGRRARRTRTPTYALAVAHAPYLRVLDQFAGDGYDAIPGRPHARRPGVRAPFVGALTTNCDLEPARAKRPAPAPGHLAGG